MYELPKEPYLQELVGQEVNLVCVGPYDAQIAFEKGIVIQALYKLESEVAGVRKLWFDGEWITTQDIIAVPKKQVIAVVNESEFVIKITLTGDVSLYFHSELSPWESINISYPNGALEVI